MEAKTEDNPKKSPEATSSKKISEDDETFLDDELLTNEFMDGLNVLDSWDENQQKRSSEERKKESRESSRKRCDLRNKLDEQRKKRSRSVDILEVRFDGRNRRSSPNYREGSPYRRGISPHRRRGSPYHRADSPLRRADSPFRRGNSPPRRGRYYHSPSFRTRDFSISPKHRRDRSPLNRDSYEKEKEKYRDYRKPRHSVERNRSKEKLIEERRDPNKTRSDIQKDKDKCQRLKEAKEFEKKIQVAETGLCPPGMEDMLDEVENSSFIMTSKKKESDKTVESKKTPVKELKKKRSEDRFSDRRDKKSSRIRSNSRERKSSRIRSSSRDRKSGRIRSNSRDRKSGRIRSNSRDRFRSRYHSDDRFSDNVRGPLDRSWNRQSPSPDPKRRKRSPFLHELARTLCKNSAKEAYNKKRTSAHNNFNQGFDNMNSPYGNSKMMPSSMPLGAPEMVQSMPGYPMRTQIGPICPPTTNIQPLGPININDGSFNFQPVQQPFQPVPDPFQSGPQLFPSMGQPFQPMPPQPIPQPQNFPIMPSGFQPVPEPVPAVPHPGLPQPFVGQNNSQIFQDSSMQSENLTILQSPATPLQKSTPMRSRPNLKDISQQSLQISKLFEDKKISLSDFLAVSAKGETVPDSIQEKIKVISRCQEAIKVLENTTKLSSRFFPRITPAIETEKDKIARNIENKWKSPLKRAAVVKFSFTTPAKRKENEIQINMKRLLATIGLIPPTVSSPQPRPSKTTEEVINLSSPLHMKNIFMQTDPYECPVCEIRNVRKFADTATQTTATYLDVATQVLPTDFLSTQPPRGILKNSISHLTAAQLREQEKPSTVPPKLSDKPPPPFNLNQFKSSPSKSWQKTEPISQIPQIQQIQQIKNDISETIFNPFNGGAMKPQGLWAVWQDVITKSNPPHIIANPSISSGPSNMNPTGPWQPASNPNININTSNNNLSNPNNVNNWKGNKKNRYRGGKKNKKKKNANLRPV